MNGKRILLVEDEAALLEMISDVLDSEGFDVQTAGDGVAALELLGRDAPFDYLVSDVMMPEGVSGIDLARQASTIQPGVHIVLVSGLSRAQLPPLPEGVSFLPKPYRIKQLLDALGA
jgi:CheY-like chemotaxis protein